MDTPLRFPFSHWWIIWDICFWTLRIKPLKIVLHRLRSACSLRSLVNLIVHVGIIADSASAVFIPRPGQENCPVLRLPQRDASRRRHHCIWLLSSGFFIRLTDGHSHAQVPLHNYTVMGKAWESPFSFWVRGPYVYSKRSRTALPITQVHGF